MARRTSPRTHQRLDFDLVRVANSLGLPPEIPGTRVPGRGRPRAVPAGKEAAIVVAYWRIGTTARRVGQAFDISAASVTRLLRRFEAARLEARFPRQEELRPIAIDGVAYQPFRYTLSMRPKRHEHGGRKNERDPLETFRMQAQKWRRREEKTMRDVLRILWMAQSTSIIEACTRYEVKRATFYRTRSRLMSRLECGDDGELALTLQFLLTRTGDPDQALDSHRYKNEALP